VDSVANESTLGHELGTSRINALACNSVDGLASASSQQIHIRPRIRLSRVSSWIAACAFIVNAHWLRIDPFALRIGYFLWWVSFLLLAIGLFHLSGAVENR
jgi:hypothetical protein